MFKKSDSVWYTLMVLPGVIFLFAFIFVPLIYSVIAFQKFNPALGIQNSPWVGLDNFTLMFRIPDARIVFRNTLFIATMKIIMLEIVAITFALLLNELRLGRVQEGRPDDGLPAALPVLGDPGGDFTLYPGSRGAAE